MATTAIATPGKTSFVKDFLNANPQGNTKEREARRKERSVPIISKCGRVGADRQLREPEAQGKGSLQMPRRQPSRQDQSQAVPQRHPRNKP